MTNPSESDPRPPKTHDSENLEILYHEGPCIVVNKPAGVATQAPPNVIGLEDSVKDYLRQRENKSGKVYLGVPHRLDRPVSGAIVFARHVRAARRLSEQFHARSVRKIYWALVQGRPPNDQGDWHDWMRKIPGKAAAEIVTPDHPDAREATLIFRIRNLTNALVGGSPLGEQSVSWLEIELQTGRTHQIRVQAASRGLSILGDKQYGSQHAFGPAQDDPRCRAIALHARLLEFENPKSRQRVQIEAPLPASWTDLGFGELVND